MPLQASEDMTLVHRLMAMSIGGVASTFALFKTPPKTRQEAVVRFMAGCFVAFSLTGLTLQLCHIPVNTDSVLATGLVLGSVGWSIIGGLVEWGNAGGPLGYLARLVQGRLDKNGKPPE